jgi:hypothetical protein
MPELYAQLPGVLDVGRLESNELPGKAQGLQALLER